MKVITAPEPLQDSEGMKSIFLAGSIEGGTAEPWQEYVLQHLNNKNLLIYNPRRVKWLDGLSQTIEEPRFKQQVDWELDALEKADVIMMYFSPDTRSPISLLELGLFASSGKMVVCCPEGFWRKGNVDIVCQRYNVQQAKNLNELIRIAIAKTEE